LETVSKENILKALRQRISELLEGNSEVFFQTLYRLDISEKKFNDILSRKVEVIDELSELIYERQLQKATLRAQYKKNETGTNEDEMSW
jgi:hypothetical protein